MEEMLYSRSNRNRAPASGNTFLKNLILYRIRSRELLDYGHGNSVRPRGAVTPPFCRPFTSMVVIGLCIFISGRVSQGSSFAGEIDSIMPLK